MLSKCCLSVVEVVSKCCLRLSNCCLIVVKLLSNVCFCTNFWCFWGKTGAWSKALFVGAKAWLSIDATNVHQVRHHFDYIIRVASPVRQHSAGGKSGLDNN